MTEENKGEKGKSTLGDRMNDFYFVVEDASGKPKGTISSTESKPDKGSKEK